jgi:hypothetical protein
MPCRSAIPSPIALALAEYVGKLRTRQGIVEADVQGACRFRSELQIEHARLKLKIS